MGRFIERETAYEGLGLERSFVGTFFLSHVVDKTLWTDRRAAQGMEVLRHRRAHVRFQEPGIREHRSSLRCSQVRQDHRADRARREVPHEQQLGERLRALLSRRTVGSAGIRFQASSSAGRRILFNNEIRFPLIDHLALSFPVRDARDSADARRAVLRRRARPTAASPIPTGSGRWEPVWSSTSGTPRC